MFKNLGESLKRCKRTQSEFLEMKTAVSQMKNIFMAKTY
jgi:hypothetical protein